MKSPLMVSILMEAVSFALLRSVSESLLPFAMSVIVKRSYKLTLDVKWPVHAGVSCRMCILHSVRVRRSVDQRSWASGKSYGASAAAWSLHCNCRSLLPGEPVACNFGILWLIHGLLWGKVAYDFGLLGFPGTMRLCCA